MDGLSPQTGEDLEAQRLQAQGEQEQTVQLQSNIDRYGRSTSLGAGVELVHLTGTAGPPRWVLV